MTRPRAGVSALLCAVVLASASACRTDPPSEPQGPTPQSAAPVASPQPAATDTMFDVADASLDRILSLETEEDVTCWTSFRQLESFIARAPLTDDATLQKLVAMRSLVTGVWSRASIASAEPVLNRGALGAARVAPRPCLLYTSPSPRDLSTSRMPSSA